MKIKSEKISQTLKNMSRKDKIILLIAVIVLGLVLINFSDLFASSRSEDTSDNVFSAEIYKNNLEKQLKTILSQVPRRRRGRYHDHAGRRSDERDRI